MLISLLAAFIKVTMVFAAIIYSFPIKKSWQRGLIRGVAILVALSISIPWGVSSAHLTGYFIPYIALPMSIIYFVVIRPRLKKRYRTATPEIN